MIVPSSPRRRAPRASPPATPMTESLISRARGALPHLRPALRGTAPRAAAARSGPAALIERGAAGAAAAHRHTGRERARPGARACSRPTAAWPAWRASRARSSPRERGIGPTRAAAIAAAIEIARRLPAETLSGRDLLNEPRLVKEFLRQAQADDTQERTGALYLNARNRLLEERSRDLPRHARPRRRRAAGDPAARAARQGGGRDPVPQPSLRRSDAVARGPRVHAAARGGRRSRRRAAARPHRRRTRRMRVVPGGGAALNVPVRMVSFAFSMKTFYATTPIYYVNDLPHIGHIYSTVVTDVITRFRRLIGGEDALPDGHRRARAEHREGRGGPGRSRRSRWPTGSSSATASSTGPSRSRNDDFIRTTEARHRARRRGPHRPHRGGRRLLHGQARGLVLLELRGLLHGEGARRREAMSGPRHARPSGSPRRTSSSACRGTPGPLLEHYDAHPEFVRPESRLAEVVFVRARRAERPLGLALEGEVGHSVSGPSGPRRLRLARRARQLHHRARASAPTDDALYREFWDHPDAERVHVIGKDILRFHAVYWPAFLLSAGPAAADDGLGPRLVAARREEGVQVRRQHRAARTSSSRTSAPDALRYFLMREMAFGQDASFSDEAFLTRYNADLANDLGNTVSRVAALCRQSFGGTPNEVCADNEVARAPAARRGPSGGRRWRECQFNRALEAVWRLLTEINGYVVVTGAVEDPQGGGRRLRRASTASCPPPPRACAWRPSCSRRSFRRPAGRSSRPSACPPTDPPPADLDWGRLPVSQPDARDCRRSFRAPTPGLTSRKRMPP